VIRRRRVRNKCELIQNAGQSPSVPVEVFVPYETANGRGSEATHVRSTLLVSSIQALRTRGFFDAYVAKLAPADRDVLLAMIAGTWVPVAVGMAHYVAADQLGLDSGTVAAMGAAVGERLNKSMLSIAVKLSKEVGATPWSALARAHRLRELTWQGSDLTVLKLGPKEARLDWVGIPYATVPYYLRAYGGFLQALIQLFCEKAYARHVPERSSNVAVSFRISWV
jgi:hypothetical protein